MTNLTPYRIADPIGQQLIEQYLNTYFREIELSGDQLLENDPDSATGTLKQQLGLLNQGIPFCWHFKSSGYQLLGILKHNSWSGHHRYGDAFLLIHSDQLQPYAQLQPQQLARLILREFSDQSDVREAFAEKVENSATNVRYLLSQQSQSHWPISGRSAEQGLLFGHPFHVLSKSMQGFNCQDLHRYGPELGAHFPLHYLALAPELIGANTPTPHPIPPSVASSAAVDSIPQGYRLLPCHPWQAEYLQQQPAIAQLKASGQLIDLGPQGEPVWPTSSVRTLYQPETGNYLKLPLNVRITNFVRNNPPDQRERTLDASAYLQQLQQQKPEFFARFPGFHLLLESGAEWLNLPDPELQAATTVLYREGQGEQRPPLVLAYLVEEAAGRPAPLLALLHEAARLRQQPLNAELIEAWWQDYLEISLRPLLHLFAEQGVSLEAHLQNSLLTLENGWPKAFYVRDMEGASIDRTRPGPLAANSPALYEREQTWQRFKYYVLVNHIAHLHAALARTGLIDQQQLWQTTDRLLAQWGEHPELTVWTEQLRQEPHWPAKANLQSTLAGRGETPSWIRLPNPLLKLADQQLRSQQLKRA